MRELLEHVTGGFRELTDEGKYIVLLLGILLYFWYGRLQKRPGEDRQPAAEAFDQPASKELLLYTTLVMFLMLFPVTGIALRLYMTRFYDYVWVIALVPVTVMLAWGAVRIYRECCVRFCKNNFRKAAVLFAYGLALLFLCGDLRSDAKENAQQAADLQKTAQLLDYLEEKGNTETVCLWAPTEILSHVKGIDGKIRLLYGRNMWEPALNAYTYDTYSPEVTEAYQWLEENILYLQGLRRKPYEDTPVSTIVKTVLQQGVNYILLPQGYYRELGAELAESVFQEIQRAGYEVTKQEVLDYYIFWIVL